MQFEWDENKARRNLKAHGVSFREGSTVFGDRLARTFADPDHSIDEDRFLTFGYSQLHRLLVVSHTQRRGRTRIISVREVAKRERGIYEDD